MKNIFEYIKEASDCIAYVSRSLAGTWTISLVKKGNYVGRTISSYQRLSDQEVESIEGMGIRVFDFQSCAEGNWQNLMDEAERLSRELCY